MYLLHSEILRSDFPVLVSRLRLTSSVSLQAAAVSSLKMQHALKRRLIKLTKKVLNERFSLYLNRHIRILRRGDVHQLLACHCFTSDLWLKTTTTT